MQQPTLNIWQQDRPRLDVRMVRQNRGEVRAPVSRGGPPSPSPAQRAAGYEAAKAASTNAPTRSIQPPEATFGIRERTPAPTPDPARPQ